MFIVELLTGQGQVSERYESLEEARRRVGQFPSENLITLPMIFEELADGSVRVVRDDGKALQWHRVENELEPPAPEQPLPVSEAMPGARIEEILPEAEEWPEQ